MACCERLRSRRKGSAGSEHGSVMWRGLRPFNGSARLATVAPWLPRKNRSHGMRRAARYSTISTYATAPARPGRPPAAVLPDVSGIGPKRPCRRPPATLHGVVFDILVGSQSDAAWLRESCLKPHTPARPLL